VVTAKNFANPCKNTGSPSKNVALIEETEINNREIHSINAPQEFEFQNTLKTSSQAVIQALKANGMPEKHFRYPDVVSEMDRLCRAGATEGDFVIAMDRARKSADKGFGVRYLVPIVESLLSERKKSSSVSHR